MKLKGKWTSNMACSIWQSGKVTFLIVLSFSELMEVTPDVLAKSEEPQIPVEEENQNQ